MSEREKRTGAAVGSTVLALALWSSMQQVQAQEAQAASDATDVAEDGLREVVVTAQFRAQSLQDTPLSITAVDAHDIESRNLSSVTDVASAAPNVNMRPGGSAQGAAAQVFIRGVGQYDSSFAYEPGVGMYVDDVYHGTLLGSMFELLDLDRVEILRGPQGTLAGKNSIGGAIKLFSQKPTGNGGGYIDVTYGSLNRVEARGAGDFTLSPDKMFVRLSFSSKHHDGYITREDYACSHPGSDLPTHSVGDGCTLGKDGSQAYDAGRIALRWLVTDAIEWNLAGDATNDQSSVQANTIIKVNPASLGGAVYTLGKDGKPVFYGSQFIPYGPQSTDPNHPNNPYLSYATYTSNAVSAVFGPDP